MKKRERWIPVLKKGHPQFEKMPDILNRQVTGFKKYKPTFIPKEEIKRNYDITNFHEVKCKFRFQINGFFAENGDTFCDELFRIAKRLFIVGWIKCRKRFVLGHFQGDSYAISYIQHWLDMYSSNENKIDTIKIFDQNNGIPNFDYYNITVVRDYRHPGKKKMHMSQSQGYLQTRSLFGFK